MTFGFMVGFVVVSIIVAERKFEFRSNGKHVGISYYFGRPNILCKFHFFITFPLAQTTIFFFNF